VDPGGSSDTGGVSGSSAGQGGDGSAGVSGEAGASNSSCDCADLACRSRATKLLRFHADTHGVSFPWPASLTIGPVRTFEGWLYVVSYGSNGGLFFDKFVSGGEDFLVRFIGDTTINAASYISGSKTTTLITSQVLSVGMWHHVALVQSATELLLFADGKEVGHATSPAPGEKAANFELGGGRGMGFEGYWANVRISSVARYSAAFQPAVQPVVDSNTVAFWQISESAGDRICDSGPHAIEGTAASLSWEVGPGRP
jgi:hypothetical protein